MSRLYPLLERVDLDRSFQLSYPYTPIDYVYFFERGIASVVVHSPEGQHAEIGIVGRDGMSPASPILDADMDPYSIFMQMPGEALRIPVGKLKALLNEDVDIRHLFARYAQVLSIQHAYTALSNAVHHIDERLARWILMCHDRTDGDEITLTHEFLSIMLAVRRPSVTTALHLLEGKKLIYSERGLVIVRDRKALESYARDAYGECEREYERLLGPLVR